jgi:hypothetical protein
MCLRNITALLVAIFVICWITKKCRHKEGYADQVMHGVAGGIAGPIFEDPTDPSLVRSIDEWDQ